MRVCQKRRTAFTVAVATAVAIGVAAVVAFIVNTAIAVIDASVFVTSIFAIVDTDVDFIDGAAIGLVRPLGLVGLPAKILLKYWVTHQIAPPRPTEDAARKVIVCGNISTQHNSLFRHAQSGNWAVGAHVVCFWKHGARRSILAVTTSRRRY